MARPSRLVVFTALIIGLLALTGPGCSSLSGPGSASFASVDIENHTVDEIAEATVKVFNADGYQGGKTSSSQMVFEREASRGTSFAREGIAGAMYGAQTINRVRADIITLGATTFRLQCKAYMVSGGGDAFFQDEVPIANFRNGPYKSLLKKVAAQLK